MANRFSDIAKQMGAKVEEESVAESQQWTVQNELLPDNTKVKKEPTASPSKEESGSPQMKANEIPTTRKTTALPLVLDLAIKEVKERRNIASKIIKSKKITEDDVVVEALELYFKKAENKSFLEAAYEKLKYFV